MKTYKDRDKDIDISLLANKEELNNSGDHSLLKHIYYIIHNVKCSVRIVIIKRKI